MTLAIFNSASLPSATPCVGILLINSWLSQVVTKLECLNSTLMSLNKAAQMGGSKVMTQARIPQKLSSPVKHTMILTYHHSNMVFHFPHVCLLETKEKHFPSMCSRKLYVEKIKYFLHGKNFSTIEI